jgi:hypothetical protein
MLGIALDCGCERRFVGIVNSGKALNLARTRPLIKALRIAAFANRQRSVYIDLYEIFNRSPRFLASRTIWRDCCHQRDDPVSSEQTRDERNSAYIFVSIFFAETQIAIEVFSQFVCIDELRANATRK